MIPLHDDNPTELRPYVTIALIVACVLVFFWQISLPAPAQQRAVLALGVIPAVLLGNARLPPELALVSPEVSVVTSMFLHGGWMHLIGNMLYLWIFGNNVEDALGRVRFVIFYVACGVGAALLQSWQDPASTIPMIGASGAIGGVLGAYLLLHPQSRILVLFTAGFIFPVVRIPAVVVLGLWFVMQFALGAASAGAQGGGGVAHWAHIGGFLTGMVLVLFMRRPGIPLFDRGHSRQQTGWQGQQHPPWRGRRRPPWRGRRGPWG